MDIRHLTYFIEVAKCRSFTRAAENLFVTQPTISKMIKNLEDELGVELFERSRKQLVLTDAGRLILEKAQTIHQAFEHLQQEIDDLVGLQKGHLRIGVPPIMDGEQIIRLLGEFHQKHPHITFELFESGAKKIEQGIQDDQLDAGITVLPTLDEHFHSFTFLKEELMVVIPPSHPLANRKQIKLEHLQNEPIIMFNKDFALNDRITTACQQAGFKPRMIAESAQWDFIGKMIAAGLGLSILPHSVTKLLKEDVHTIRIIQPTMHWSLALIWKKDHYVSYATRAWLSFTQERMMLEGL
ncbi:LysR family transcriptional regulator [Bacillaceae bacterium SIJ1]|uniref:cidABC operon transcriptional activator CidR n=1 Tax=Litoribacterium kuwaitense TaxID=1398745 RepID=UPI0013EA66E9|nr:LysR family transcriptional regulator [Litoribacterium kuwaitense]NGP45954.1 LysR family transcriptional regulator [Litoribacterium kuwaitense]